MERKSITLSLETKADEKGMFEGHGSIFGNVDLGGDVVEKGAFIESLDKFHEKGQLPSLYWNHDMGEPIGDWLEMREDDQGLYVKGKLWVQEGAQVENAVKAHNMLKGTGNKGLSIGYRVVSDSRETRDGRDVRVLKEIDLYEVSVVGWGMNPAAQVTAVKSMLDADGKILSKREVERALREAGLSSNQAKAFLARGYDGLVRDAKTEIDVDLREANLDQEALNDSLKSLLHSIRKSSHV